MIKIIKYNNNYFLVDTRHKVFVDLNQIGKMIRPIPLWVIDYDQRINNEPMREDKIFKSATDLLQLIIPDQNINQEGHRPKRKRRNYLNS